MSALPLAIYDGPEEIGLPPPAKASQIASDGAIVGPVTLLRVPAVGVAHAWVERGINVEVTGTRVCGKTSLLNDLQSRLSDEGWNVVRIDGLRTLRSHPLEALAVAGLIEIRKPAPPVSAVVDRLWHGWAEERTVVLVDDVDYLDRASCGVLESLTRRMPLQIVSTSSLHPSDPSGRTGFQLPHPCAELTLRPWRFEELNSLLVGHVDHVIDPRLAGQIHQLSGGVPGFALALLNSAEMESRLKVHREALSSDDRLWHDGLSRIVEDYIGPLPAEERATLESLSAWGPLSVAEAARLVPPEHLRTLERHRLVTVVRTGHHATMVVFPPLVAEYLTRQSGEIERLLGDDSAASSRADSSRADGENDPYSASVDRPEFLPEASGAYSRLLGTRRRSQGLQLAEAWAAHPTATTATPYIKWLVSTRDPRSELDEVTARTRWEEGLDFERTMAFMDLARWEAAAGLGVDAALALLAERREGTGVFAPILDHVKIQLRVIAGDVPDEDEGLVPLDDAMPAAILISAAATRSYYALTTGNFAEAQVASTLIGTTSSRPRTYLMRALAVSAQGDPLGGLRVAREGLDVARSVHDEEGIYVGGYACAYILQRLGRRREAGEVLDLPLSLGRPRPDLEPLYQAQLAMAARLAMQAGDHERARALAQQAQALQLRDGPLPAMSDLVVDLIRESGPVREVPSHVWARIEAMWQRRHRCAAISWGLSVTETIPDAELAATVAGWIATIGANAMVPSGEYVVALAASDPERLIASVPGLIRTGWPARAVVALRIAEELFFAMGNKVSARDARAQQARLLASDPEIEPDLALNRLSSAQLSDREREIVALIARGLTNRQIADELVLSVRTVENHIYRAFRKTRLTSRGQLGRIAL